MRQRLLNWLCLGGVFIGLVILVTPLSFGIKAVAEKFVTESKVLPPGELPFYESDNYKWATWAKTGGTIDTSELQIGQNPILIQWASPNRIYLKTLYQVGEWLSPNRGGNLALFFSMPILLVIGGALLSAISIFYLNDRFTGIVLPLSMGAIPAIYTQMFASRPDHHGLILILSALFVLSLTQKDNQNGKILHIQGIISGLIAALALWVSTVSFIPILGVFSIGLALGSLQIKAQLKPIQEINLAYESPIFWKYWSYTVVALGFIFWLVDYSYRGFHMEVINPLWLLSIGAGGLFLRQILEPKTNKIQALIWLALAALGPLACTQESLFWTRSAEVVAFHKDVFELAPGKTTDYILLMPFGFIALTLAASVTSMRWLILGAVLASTLYLWQVRWLPIAIIPAVIVACRAYTLSRQNPLKPVIAALFTLQLFWTGSSTIQEGLKNISQKQDTPETFKLASYSAILKNELAKLPEGHIIGTPNLTAYIHYFTGRKAVGSVYWESKENMGAAAKILSAPPSKDAWAKAWLRKHGIKYIVLTPQLFSSPYQGDGDAIAQSLEYRIITGKSPNWVKEILRIQEPWPGLILARITNIGEK